VPFGRDFIIDRTGVIPIPPATKTYLFLTDFPKVKIPRGPSIQTLVPGRRFAIFDVKSPNDNNIHLYIKTNDLTTVNSEKLEKLCSKFTTDEVVVTFQIPTGKITDGIHEIPNTDLVCIFIELLEPFDHESFVAFG